MARKGKQGKGQVAATSAAPSHFNRVVTAQEQEAIRDARVDTHLRRARSLVAASTATAGSAGKRVGSTVDPDLVAAAAVSGKAAAAEKERARLAARATSLKLDQQKRDDLKCRPKTHTGNGSGRAFVPWSKNC